MYRLLTRYLPHSKIIFDLLGLTEFYDANRKLQGLFDFFIIAGDGSSAVQSSSIRRQWILCSS